MKPETRSWHLPPLKQGSEKQGLISRVSLKASLTFALVSTERKKMLKLPLQIYSTG